VGNLKISKKAVYKGITYIILTLGLIIVVLPMIYMLSTALKPNGALYEYPPRFFPKIKEITLENFQYILHQKKFGNNFINSIFVSTVTVAIAAIVAAAMEFENAR
jgi:multiple sugar transport system permease protein